MLSSDFTAVSTKTATLAQTSIALPREDQILNAFKSPEHLMLGAGVLAFIALSVAGNRTKKAKLATGNFGGAKEKRNARKIGLKQMKAKKRNSVALYIGKPKDIIVGSRDRQTLFLPNAQEGIAVCGGPGKGKTYSVINPCVRSAIDQGYPVILYDFKYPSQNGICDGSSQTEQIVGYADKHGYRINFFTPGFKESDVCNPLDFLRSPSDAETARQLGTVMNRNFRMLAQDKEDPFFGPAGDQLCEAVFMLAKSSPYPDVMTCQAILSMDKLVERLGAAQLDYLVVNQRSVG